MKRAITTQTVICLDIETPGLKVHGGKIFSLTVTYNGGKCQTYANPNGLTKKDLPAKLIADLESEDVIKVAHNAVFDASMLKAVLGINVRGFKCTQLQETVIQGRSLPRVKRKERTPEMQRLYSAHGVAVEDVFPRYGFKAPDKNIREAFIDRPLGIPFTKKELGYMEDDVKPLYQIFLAQLYIIQRDEIQAVVDLENEYLRKRIAAKVRGLNFDSKFWRTNALANGKEYEKRIAKLPTSVKNWGSEKQVKTYFKNKGIIIPTYTSKHPDQDDLDSMYIKTHDRELGDFILACELNKSVTSYGLNWFEDDIIDSDGRIRLDVFQIKETGRTSMEKLHQLPGPGRQDYLHDEVMRLLYGINPRIKPQHRQAFIPTPGNQFVIGDFSGQELGIMAAAAEEKLWIDAMLRGDDVHGLTASLLYAAEWGEGADADCVFPKKCNCRNHYAPRQRAKILNFMLAYGGGAPRFQRATGLSNLDARITIARYKKIIPALTKYLDKNGRMAEMTGESFSADPYRRRRILAGERMNTQGKNNPIQAAGANMLKLAAISVPDKYYSPLEIHDEIILDVAKNESRAALACLESVMNKAADYITGIKGLITADPRIAMNILKEAGTKKHDLYGNKLKHAA